MEVTSGRNTPQTSQPFPPALKFLKRLPLLCQPCGNSGMEPTSTSSSAAISICASCQVSGQGQPEFLYSWAPVQTQGPMCFSSILIPDPARHTAQNKILLIRANYSKSVALHSLAQGHVLSGWWANRSAHFQQSEELKSDLTSAPTLVFDTVKTIFCLKATADCEWGRKGKPAVKFKAILFLKLDDFQRKRFIKDVN